MLNVNKMKLENLFGMLRFKIFPNKQLNVNWPELLL